MGKMSDWLVKVGENDCWAQCHMGTMSRFGVIWAHCHVAVPIWHREGTRKKSWETTKLQATQWIYVTDLSLLGTIILQLRWR